MTLDKEPDFGQRFLMGPKGQSKFWAFICKYLDHDMMGVTTISTDINDKPSTWSYCKRCNLQEPVNI